MGSSTHGSRAGKQVRLYEVLHHDVFGGDMTAWNIDAAAAHSIVNRTAVRAEALLTAAASLRDAVEGAQAASNSSLVAGALAEAYEGYAGLLIQNASDKSETACTAVQEALTAYQGADLEMAATAQRQAGRS